MNSNFKIDYAIISNNQNPEYKQLFPYIKRRWNQLGIKTIYINCSETEDKEFNINQKPTAVDSEGNLYFDCKIPDKLDVLDRWFPIMIARYLYASHELFQDKVVIISDGDLFPINKKYIYQPSYDINMNSEVVELGHIITTNIYPHGEVLSTYTYGLGRSFRFLLTEFNKVGKAVGLLTMDSIISDAERYARKIGKMYMNDEHYMNYRYSLRSSNFMRNTMNRKWIEMCQEMNNLYEFQIDLLKSWQDLCPFIEFHNMRASTMTEEKWDKLFNLLETYDQMDITPNNWFWNSVDMPLRNTIITPDGHLIIPESYES